MTGGSALKIIGEITSRTNEKIKKAYSLLNGRERRETGLFLIEGIRLVVDAALSGVEIKTLFATEAALEKFRDELSSCENTLPGCFIISEHICEKLSDTKNPQGIFAVCRIPENKIISKPDGLYIVTDNIQNPDNLGAIVRTAEALGMDGLYIIGGCDIYSPKAIRASMGGLLRFPVSVVTDEIEFLNSMKAEGFRLCATVPDASAQDITKCGIHSSACLIIGNEGNGISDNVLSICTDFLTIPMKGKAESLNASTAAAIAIWELCRS